MHGKESFSVLQCDMMVNHSFHDEPLTLTLPLSLNTKRPRQQQQAALLKQVYTLI